MMNYCGYQHGGWGHHHDGGVAKGKNLTADGIALAIRGYELAFLADLVASYVFEMTEKCFMKMIFQEIYQDDRLVVFERKWTRRVLAKWLAEFTSMVEKSAGGDYLQFTTKLWYLETDDDPYLESGGGREQGCGAEYLEEGLLQEKPAVEICGLPKYTQAIYVQIRYYRCTDKTGQKEDEALTNQEGNRRKDRWATYFVLGYINFIHKATIPKLIKALWKCYNLKWIRISNMRGRFSGDLGRKITRGLVSKDFMCRPCNCNAWSKVNANCRTYYAAKNYLDEKPDTKVSKLTKHLARWDHWPELSTSTKPTLQMIHCKLKFDIIYQANPITA
eukprot:1989691-Ditylum_brightwellii.AAC.1